MSLPTPGDLIKKALKEKGLTQAKLARLSNNTPSNISKVLDRKHRLTAEIAVSLEEFLDVSAETLLLAQLRLEVAEARRKLRKDKDDPLQMEFNNL